LQRGRPLDPGHPRYQRRLALPWALGAGAKRDAIKVTSAAAIRSAIAQAMLAGVKGMDGRKWEIEVVVEMIRLETVTVGLQTFHAR
jgi:hypothetical protein